METVPVLNTPEGFSYYLKFFLGTIWDWFTNTPMPFFGGSIAQFWLTFAAISIVLWLIRFWLFGIGDGVKVFGHSIGGNRISVDKERAND